MCLTLLQDSRLYEFLLTIDREFAAKARADGCHCSGRVHRADYERKPRGGPSGLGPEYDKRFSFCCAVEGCRSRKTPPSVRFLGRRVYLGAVVLLVSAMQGGITDKRATDLQKRLGVSRRTLWRWRSWWREAFPGSDFWKAARGRFMPCPFQLLHPACSGPIGKPVLPCGRSRVTSVTDSRRACSVQVSDRQVQEHGEKTDGRT